MWRCICAIVLVSAFTTFKELKGRQWPDTESRLNERRNHPITLRHVERSRGTTKGVLGTRNHSIGLREFLVANTIIYRHNFEIDFPWTPLNIEVHMHDSTRQQANLSTAIYTSTWKIPFIRLTSCVCLFTAAMQPTPCGRVVVPLRQLSDVGTLYTINVYEANVFTAM